jgi:hypothetical protein
MIKAPSCRCPVEAVRQILEMLLPWVGIVPPKIDQINILQATRLAMSRAVMESALADYLLVDSTISLDLLHTATGHYQRSLSFQWLQRIAP